VAPYGVIYNAKAKPPPEKGGTLSVSSRVPAHRQGAMIVPIRQLEDHV